MEQPRVWYSPVRERFYGQAEPQVFEAQMIQPGDISAIEAVTILDEVLGLARPDYILRQICRKIRMDHLTARIDIAGSQGGRRAQGAGLRSGQAVLRQQQLGVP